MSTTQAERLEYYLSEYMAQDGYFMRPPTVEEGHTKRCMADAMISVLQNFRDDSGVRAYEFSLLGQDGSFYRTALEYLDSGLSTCQCPPRFVEESHYLVLHRQLKDSGEWVKDVHWTTLSDAVATLSADMDYGLVQVAWIGLHDFHDDEVTPCLWASLGMVWAPPA